MPIKKRIPPPPIPFLHPLPHFASLPSPFLLLPLNVPIKRLQHPPPPIRNPIHESHIPDPIEHQPHTRLQILKINSLRANPCESVALVAHAEDEEDAD
jgi:hypothetical protein